MNPSYFLPNKFPPGPSNYNTDSSSSSASPRSDLDEDNVSQQQGGGRPSTSKSTSFPTTHGSSNHHHQPPSHSQSQSQSQSHSQLHSTSEMTTTTTTTTTATAGQQGQGQIQTGPMIHPHQDLHSFLESFWTRQMETVEIENPDWKSYNLPLARIKKVMKSDEEVKMISAEAPIMFSKACEIFISELTYVAAAIAFSDMFDFLIDIVPRDDGSSTSTPAAPGNGNSNGGNGVGGGESGAPSVGGAEEESDHDEDEDGDVQAQPAGFNDDASGAGNEEGDDLYNEYVHED
ncbi:hypothetical protein IAR55_006960 [Kwoniella newhampshirensis]|uniref:Transcription factor CBF/NF-Y/archaeal histone domain-containing protein n=1 Tax=Kwoniella newhampshirensis TaxID=1651941 RepID=A0AAW0YDU5_9TREE